MPGVVRSVAFLRRVGVHAAFGGRTPGHFRARLARVVCVLNGHWLAAGVDRASRGRKPTGVWHRSRSVAFLRRVGVHAAFGGRHPGTSVPGSPVWCVC